ncbi:TipAS antibiotic-recognition domain-containing protein [Candidatus Neomarinimicrobiota bacterium]
MNDPRLRAVYEKIKPGLAEFMRAAIVWYAEHVDDR